MKVMIVKEVMTGDVSPVTMFVTMTKKPREYKSPGAIF